MVFEVKDYSFLLDNLKRISENYSIDGSGNIVNKDGDIETNEYIIINTKFYNLYCMAYKDLAEVLDNYPIETIDRAFINRALSDYHTFNRFINNCIVEYKMYDDLGTQKISYTPNSVLSRGCFRNKWVVYDYLKCELSEIFNNEDNKRVRI